MLYCSVCLCLLFACVFFFFFFNDTATTEIYTLSLHDALPISAFWIYLVAPPLGMLLAAELHVRLGRLPVLCAKRSEEHTSELQSRLHLVCRLLLEKKKPSSGSTMPTPALSSPASSIPRLSIPR